MTRTELIDLLREARKHPASEFPRHPSAVVVEMIDQAITRLEDDERRANAGPDYY